MRRKPGMRTERSEHERQWRWPLCLPNALALICCNMQLYACVQNSFGADRQRRAGVHDLAARFVYVFRGASEKERRGRKDTGQTAASADCSVGKLNFEIRSALQQRWRAWFSSALCLRFQWRGRNDRSDSGLCCMQRAF